MIKYVAGDLFVYGRGVDRPPLVSENHLLCLYGLFPTLLQEWNGQTAYRTNGSYFTVNMGLQPLNEWNNLKLIVMRGLNGANLNSAMLGENKVLGESCCTSEKCWTSKLWKVLGCLSRASLQAAELLQLLISEVVGGCHTSNLETTSEFLSESDTWSFGDWDRHEESPLHCRVLWSPRDVKFLRGSRHWLADYLTPSCQSGKNCQKLPVVPVIMVIIVSAPAALFPA